jgi:hypothetical protein
MRQTSDRPAAADGVPSLASSARRLLTRLLRRKFRRDVMWDRRRTHRSATYHALLPLAGPSEDDEILAAMRQEGML